MQRSYLSEKFYVYFSATQMEEFSRLFIHKSWANVYFPEYLQDYTSEYYAELGKEYHKLLILENIIQQRFFSTDSIAYYSIILENIIGKYKYYNILNQTGLNFLLFKGELTPNFSQVQYRAILGFFASNSKINIHNLYNSFFSYDAEFIHDYAEREHDYKTKLQETKSGQFRPIYKVVRQEGRTHKQIFYVDCYIGNIKIAEGFGQNKKMAEQDAAKNALQATMNEVLKFNKDDFKSLKRYSITEERIKQLTTLKIDNDNISSNIKLLDIALTHKSIINEVKNKRSNDILALLGSHIERVSVILNEKNNFNISLLRKKLSTPISLIYSHVFDELKLNKYLIILKHIEITSKIKTNVVQALITCIYINSNIDETCNFIKPFWEKYYIDTNMGQQPLHPMNIIQERVAQKIKNNPERSGTIGATEALKIEITELIRDDVLQYKAILSVDNVEYSSAYSTSKKGARKKVAELALVNKDFLKEFPE